MALSAGLLARANTYNQQLIKCQGLVGEEESHLAEQG
jgi:hypothetical protein